MNDSERSSPDYHLDRRTVLKVAAGASAAVVAPRAVSGAVLANNNEIVALSARAAADYIRRGELSAECYAQVLLERYKAHTNLNAIAYIDEAKLLEGAREVDRARVRGAQLGPLAGLPVIIKDNVNTVGFPTTAGTRFLKDYRPKANARLADMIFRQGAILFAKANMHELALGSTSANPTFGFVKNPYDLTRIPGGSSGGTAAALAARIVPLGIGSDTTGSIRMPSHFCGTAGLRPSNPPTDKLYPVDGIVPLEVIFDVAGPMARNVADVAFMHSARDAEVTGERIRDEIGASKRRGLWVGGMVPLCYVSRDKKLVIDKEDAERVRTIFRRYLDLGSIPAPGRPSRARDRHQSPPSLQWTHGWWHPLHQRPARLSPAQPVLHRRGPVQGRDLSRRTSADPRSRPVRGR
jgi:hypothetical protein